jgi:hypothetical protein
MIALIDSAVVNHVNGFASFFLFCSWFENGSYEYVVHKYPIRLGADGNAE